MGKDFLFAEKRAARIGLILVFSRMVHGTASLPLAEKIVGTRAALRSRFTPWQRKPSSLRRNKNYLRQLEKARTGLKRV